MLSFSISKWANFAASLGRKSSDPGADEANFIQSQTGESADVAKPKPTFSAYGITQDDDPVSQALRGLIDYTVEQDKQIALLWQALAKLASAGPNAEDLLPKEAAKFAHLEIEKLNKLID